MVYKPQSRAAAGRPNTPVCAVASSFCAAEQESVRGRVLKAYFAELDEQEHQQRNGRQQTITYTASFRPVAQAVPSRDIWLIVETGGLEGVALEITLRCARSDKLLPQDAAVPFVLAGAETLRGSVSVGGWDGGGRYTHTEAYGSWAIAALRIGPAAPAARRDWAEKLERCEGHRVLCYLELRAITGIPVDYSNEDPARSGTTQDKSVFMNEPARHLQLLCCCRADITAGQLRQVFPGAPADKVQAVADELNREYMVSGRRQRLFEIFQVDTCLRRAHFFAQAKVESETVKGEQLIGAFEGESFNYRAAKLVDGSVFSFINDPDKPHLIEAALDYGRGPYKHIYPDGKRTREVPAAQAADQKSLANTFNMDENRPARIRLGNTQPGDGWKYRGHGMLQLTGRENFTNAQRWLDTALPGNTADLLNCGDNFTAFQAVVAAGFYWMSRGPLFEKADNGTSNAVVDSITRLINSGMKKKEARRTAFIETLRIFSYQECYKP